MKLTTNTKQLVTIAFVVLIAAVVLLTIQGRPAHAAVGIGTNISVATTTAQIAVTTSTRILASTTNALGNGTSYTRVYATICNPNANPVYLNLDGDKPAGVSAVTTIIAAAAGYNACYEITDRNQYSGSITASSTGETSTKISVKDYVQ